jgi:hypothetical protein
VLKIWLIKIEIFNLAILGDIIPRAFVLAFLESKSMSLNTNNIIVKSGVLCKEFKMILQVENRIWMFQNRWIVEADKFFIVLRPHRHLTGEMYTTVNVRHVCRKNEDLWIEIVPKFPKALLYFNFVFTNRNVRNYNHTVKIYFYIRYS